MVKIKIVTSELGGRQVGRIVDLNALDSDATLKEALDYGYVTGNVSRIDIAASAITGLTEDDDGKTIVFTVRGNFSSGKIVAKVKVPAQPVPAPTVVISKVKTGSVDGKIVLDEDAFQIVGEHLEKLEGDTLKVKGTSDQGEPVEYDIPYATFTCNGDGTQLTVQITEAMRDAFYSGWTWDEVTLEYTSHAGVAGSAAQVTTGTAEVTNE